MHFQLGRRLHDAGQLAEAEPIFRDVLAADPDHAESQHRLGLIAMQSGRMETALTAFDRAIARRRSNALFHVHRAHALLGLGRSMDALHAARQAQRLKPQMPEAALAVGHALYDLFRPADAVVAYRDALRRDPQLPDLRNSLALALWDADRHAEAIAILRDIVRSAPSDVAAKQNLVGMLKDSGMLPEAEALARDILRRRPDDAVTHFN
ncbi:MAG: tetratricopeptide repeat protein, partial [Rhodospirillales bacterium]